MVIHKKRAYAATLRARTQTEDEIPMQSLSHDSIPEVRPSVLWSGLRTVSQNTAVTQ